MMPFTREQFLDVFVAYNEVVWPPAGVLASAQTAQVFATIFDVQALRQAGYGDA